MVERNMGIMLKVLIVIMNQMKILLNVVLEIMKLMMNRLVQQLFIVKPQAIIFPVNFIVMGVNFI